MVGPKISDTTSWVAVPTEVAESSSAPPRVVVPSATVTESSVIDALLSAYCAPVLPKVNLDYSYQGRSRSDFSTNAFLLPCLTCFPHSISGSSPRVTDPHEVPMPLWNAPPHSSQYRTGACLTFVLQTQQVG